MVIFGVLRSWCAGSILRNGFFDLFFYDEVALTVREVRVRFELWLLVNVLVNVWVSVLG